MSVIVPARNEEANIRRCLQSLLAQSGVAFEVIVVNDHSTDRTRELSLEFPGVRVLDAGAVEPGWTGKANALVGALPYAHGEWLLFTDADTFHLPGSLQSAVCEAERYNLAMLSYSPAQDVRGVLKRGLMTVIFAELASRYPSDLVNDPDTGVAAANGQYILVRRSAYDAVGGHRQVAMSLLEDVALARLFKTANYPLRFRSAGEAVRTEMYRTWPALIEGWTKNLALLFPHPLALALFRAGEFVAILWFIGRFLVSVGLAQAGAALFYGVVALLQGAFFVRRMKRAHSSGGSLAEFVGLPLFAALLLRSYFQLAVRRRVQWKGRAYISSWPS